MANPGFSRGKGGKLPVFLRTGEVSALLLSPTSLRDRCILRLLYYCALRVSEVLDLRLEDIDFKDHVIKICHATTASGRPKGGKERLVPVDPETLRLIQEYALGQDAGPLFDIQARQVERLIKHYAQEAGIQGWARVTPHKLRHSFSVHWIQRGGDIERLRRILGHTSLAITQVYLRFSMEDIKSEYARIIEAASKDGGNPVTILTVYEGLLGLSNRLDQLTKALRRDVK